MLTAVVRLQWRCAVVKQRVMAASESIKEALLLQEVLMFAGLGGYEIDVRVDSSATRILPSAKGWTHEAQKFENLVASRLHCCGKSEIEEDTENKIWQTS